MQSHKQPQVLFIMTGSIACYKAAQVISRLVQKNISVQVVATEAALKFVGEATLEGLSGKPVLSDIYARGQMMDHIHLVREADLILVAPATANYINKIASGLGEDLASTLFLAHDFEKPFVLAPAMNSQMYLHPVTQASLQKLKSLPAVSVLNPAEGVLACGEEGPGKLLDPDLILNEVLQKLAAPAPENEEKKSLALTSRKRILVTAGGTQEKIDQVRAITNLSSGQTGIEISKYLSHLGSKVHLLIAAHSPLLKELQQQLPFFSSLEIQTFTDYQSLKKLLDAEIKNHHYDVLIHGAAVSDYSVEKIESLDGSELKAEKISGPEELVLRLKKNPKLIDQIKDVSKNKNISLIGFKLTSQASEKEIYEKVDRLFSLSNCDFVIHNDTAHIDKKNNKHKFNFCTLGLREKIDFKECSDIDQLNFELSKAVLSEANL